MASFYVTMARVGGRCPCRDSVAGCPTQVLFGCDRDSDIDKMKLLYPHMEVVRDTRFKRVGPQGLTRREPEYTKEIK